VEALIRDDLEALRMFQEAIVSKKGKRAKPQDNSHNVTIKPSQRGNRRAYLLERLHRQAPDYYARVVAGELSAHAAAVAAGIIKDKTPLEQLHYWWGKASAQAHEPFRAANWRIGAHPWRTCAIPRRH